MLTGSCPGAVWVCRTTRQEMPKKGHGTKVMSQLLKNLTASAGGGPSDPPATEPPASQNVQIAGRVIAAVMAAKSEIVLEPPLPSAVAYVRANSSMDLNFIIGLVGLIESNPQLKAAAITFDIAEAKETIDYIQAYVPVANELESFLRALKFSIAAKKAVVGAKSLRTYQALQGFARDQKLDLATHTAILKRTLHPRRKKAQQPAPPVPAEQESGKEGAKSQPEPK